MTKIVKLIAIFGISNLNYPLKLFSTFTKNKNTLSGISTPNYSHIFILGVICWAKIERKVENQGNPALRKRYQKTFQRKTKKIYGISTPRLLRNPVFIVTEFLKIDTVMLTS